MRKLLLTTIILASLLVAACSGATTAAKEKEPEKNYYYIVGEGVDKHPQSGVDRTSILINYKGLLKTIGANNRRIAPEVKSLVGACMYGYITESEVNAVIKTCPEDMAQQQ